MKCTKIQWGSKYQTCRLFKWWTSVLYLNGSVKDFDIIGLERILIKRSAPWPATQSEYQKYSTTHTHSRYQPAQHTYCQGTHPHISGQRQIPTHFLCLTNVLFFVGHSCYCLTETSNERKESNARLLKQSYDVGMTSHVNLSKKIDFRSMCSCR